jgi:DNA polymerase-1
MINLPVIDKTDSKQPATGGETLEKLVNHTKDPDVIAFLKALIDFKSVDKILTSFIPALESAQLGPDGWYYLFGNFNLGGTVSGRLSSSDPNLQNLPATGSKYAKLIKECFAPPPGWLFCGVDFNSLEDRISALTTKDPNKIKVYTDGYDGHSLRAYAYFGDLMPDIDPNSVQSINSIQKLYKSLRQDSKIPTFSLTYAGTYITIVNSMGWTISKAQKIESAYHALYVASDLWVKDRLDQASKDGYVTCAFGLRVRTPLLHQVVRGTRKTPFAAEAEGRTAGNALGQSWCLLNSRAASEFMGVVRKSKYRLDIRPCAQIHDANYVLIRDDLETVRFANEHLIKAVQWQGHPDIMHPEVKLGGEFTIFHPNWSKEIGIPNDASIEEIIKSIDDHYIAENKQKEKST